MNDEVVQILARLSAIDRDMQRPGVLTFDAAALIRKQASALAEARSGACVWSEQNNHDLTGVYDTGCGHTFWLNEDTPSLNGFKFCLYFGGDLKDESKPQDQASGG